MLKQLSVIIPADNEEERIETALIDIAKYLFAEVPVTWTHCQKESETRIWSPILTALRTFNSIFQLKQRF